MPINLLPTPLRSWLGKDFESTGALPSRDREGAVSGPALLYENSDALH
jgi:hypothetical protein